MFVLQQFGPILNVVDDPISILLVLVGAVLIGASSGLVGYLAAGAALDLVTTD